MAHDGPAAHGVCAAASLNGFAETSVVRHPVKSADCENGVAGMDILIHY